MIEFYIHTLIMGVLISLFLKNSYNCKNNYYIRTKQIEDGGY